MMRGLVEAETGNLINTFKNHQRVHLITHREENEPKKPELQAYWIESFKTILFKFVYALHLKKT